MADLTRRDRAAMVLAMCQLRSGRHSLGRAIATLREGGGLGSADIGTAAFLAWRDTGSNMLRARLALYLRARLRADAVERYDEWADDAPHTSPRWRGPVCSGCVEHVVGYEVGDMTDAPCPKTGKRESVRQCRPLWEQAR